MPHFFSLKNAWFCESIGFAARPAFTAVYVARIALPLFTLVVGYFTLIGRATSSRWRSFRRAC
jgi:hypothetical protein